MMVRSLNMFRVEINRIVRFVIHATRRLSKHGWLCPETLSVAFFITNVFNTVPLACVKKSIQFGDDFTEKKKS